jgi:hypothetical protein
MFLTAKQWMFARTVVFCQQRAGLGFNMTTEKGANAREEDNKQAYKNNIEGKDVSTEE